MQPSLTSSEELILAPFHMHISYLTVTVIIYLLSVSQFQTESLLETDTGSVTPILPGIKTVWRKGQMSGEEPTLGRICPFRLTLKLLAGVACTKGTSSSLILCGHWNLQGLRSFLFPSLLFQLLL